jgi:dienelactone hydrolase
MTAFRLLRDWPEVDPDKVGMAGYSFGGTMALLTGIAEPEVKGVAVVSPPLGLLDYPDMYAYSGPLLLVGGERDLMAPGARITAVRERLPSTAETVVIQEADRSWGGSEERLAQEVTRFFRKVLRET